MRRPALAVAPALAVVLAVAACGGPRDPLAELQRRLDRYPAYDVVLERMKDKVNEQESLAEAYGDLADTGQSVDREIDAALATPTASPAASSLADLKKRMGISA